MDRDLEKDQSTSDRSDAEPGNTRPPYDTSDLDKLPRPTADDPPYRSWWVL